MPQKQYLQPQGHCEHSLVQAADLMLPNERSDAWQDSLPKDVCILIYKQGATDAANIHCQHYMILTA